MGMAPTINDGDKLIVDLGFYKRGKDVERFDIVPFRLPEMSEDLFHYKRVVGLPGERLEINGGQVFVNGNLLHEPFETQKREDDFGPIVVPDGEYFVLGDNRLNSADSRIWKPATVRKDGILGKIVEIVPAKK